MANRVRPWLEERREAIGEWLLEFSVLVAVFVPLDVLVLAPYRGEEPHILALAVYATLGGVSGFFGVEFSRKRFRSTGGGS
ncbi:MAG: hypothetical protein HY720_10885 [Planctomycetes bacterium]|nr:hypothetical protein [Planctomycetota bacterium]